MMTNQILGYLATVAVVVLAPGPSTLLTAAHGVSHGTRGTLPTIAGDLSANVLQMAAAGVGLGVLVTASRQAFLTVKWAGVAYLLYLGWRQWRSHIGGPDGAMSLGPWARYLHGFVNSAANPKAIIFFAALFPQFIDPTIALLPQLVVLGGVFLVSDGGALLLYAGSGMRLTKVLRARGHLRLTHRVSGGAMMAVAGLLALKEVPTRT